MNLQLLPPFAICPLAAIAFFYLPGWALLAPASSALPRAFVRVLASAIVSTLVGTALAATGHFSLEALLVGNVAAAFALLLVRDAVAGLPSTDARPQDRVGPLLFAVALLAYWPAYPAFLGASDSTAYVATGISLAHHGRLDREDALGMTVPKQLRPLLFDTMSQVFGTYGPPYRRMPGAMMLESLDADRAWPDFFPVPAVWAATFVVAHAPGGSAAEEAAPEFAPFFAALALWAFWLLARSWLGANFGFFAVLMLGASGPFYNAARMPLSEPVAAFFSLGALAILSGAARPLRRADALLAGAALGAAAFTRIETALLVAMALAIAPSLVDRSNSDAQGRKLPKLFLASMAAVSSLVLVEIAMIPGTYVSPLLDHLRNARIYYLLEGGLPSLLAVIAGVALAVATAVVVTLRIRISAALRWGFVVAVVVAHAFAASWLVERTPMWLSFAIGWPGLALAAIGAVLAWKQRFELPAASLVLALAAAVTLILFYNPHVYPVVPWGARRYVPLLLPLLVLLACHAAARAATRSRLLSLVAAAALAACVAAGGKPFWGNSLMIGAWEQLDQVLATIPKDGTLLVDRDISATMLEPALWLIHDRNSIPAPPTGSNLGREALPWLVWYYAKSGPVYFLTRGSGNQMRTPKIRLTLVSQSSTSLRFLEQTYDRRPEKTERYIMPLAVYRLEPSLDPRGAPVPH